MKTVGVDLQVVIEVLRPKFWRIYHNMANDAGSASVSSINLYVVTVIEVLLSLVLRVQLSPSCHALVLMNVSRCCEISSKSLQAESAVR